MQHSTGRWVSQLCGQYSLSFFLSFFLTSFPIGSTTLCMKNNSGQYDILSHCNSFGNSPRHGKYFSWSKELLTLKSNLVLFLGMRFAALYKIYLEEHGQRYQWTNSGNCWWHSQIALCWVRWALFQWWPLQVTISQQAKNSMVCYSHPLLNGM